MAGEREKKDTDDLGQRGARLGRDEGDQVEGESLVIEMSMIPGQYDATSERLMGEGSHRRRPPGP